VRETPRQSWNYLSGTKKTVTGAHQTACVVFMLAATGVI
jgi:hypothetical protein